MLVKVGCTLLCTALCHGTQPFRSRNERSKIIVHVVVTYMLQPNHPGVSKWAIVHAWGRLQRADLREKTVFWKVECHLGIRIAEYTHCWAYTLLGIHIAERLSVIWAYTLLSIHIAEKVECHLGLHIAEHSISMCPQGWCFACHVTHAMPLHVLRMTSARLIDEAESFSDLFKLLLEL